MTRHRSPDRLPWSMPVIVAQIPEAGQRVEIEADAATRAALAAMADLPHITSARATFDLQHGRRGSVEVSGRVRASIGQICVVTLDPVENEIDESFDLTFVPDEGHEAATAQRPAPTPASPDEEVEDPPELIENGRIDLGQLAAEYLFLGIDPYPRKPDAVFEPQVTGPDPEEHPFAALQVLKEASIGKGDKGTDGASAAAGSDDDDHGKGSAGRKRPR